MMRGHFGGEHVERLACIMGPLPSPLALKESSPAVGVSPSQVQGTNIHKTLQHE